MLRRGDRRRAAQRVPDARRAAARRSRRPLGRHSTGACRGGSVVREDVLKPIVSPNTRIRHPEHFEIGDDSIVDDFCYLSTRVRIGRGSHIASGCSIAGGVDRLFVLGDFCSLSSGVKIWCTSDDFVNDLVTLVPDGVEAFKEHLISGDVIFGNCTAAGSNSVVMPGNEIPDGTVIGALSFVPAGFQFEPWSVYAGVPVRRIAARNRRAVEAQAERLQRGLDARKNER
jgi:acetyltransferase-like isoleucine patch superfamily enzyme